MVNGAPKSHRRARCIGLQAAVLTNGQTRRAVGADWPCLQEAPRETWAFAQKYPTMLQLCVTLRQDRCGNHLVHRDGSPGSPPLTRTRRHGRRDDGDDARRAARVFLEHVHGCFQRLLQRHAPCQIRARAGQAAP